MKDNNKFDEIKKWANDKNLEVSTRKMSHITDIIFIDRERQLCVMINDEMLFNVSMERLTQYIEYEFGYLANEEREKIMRLSKEVFSHHLNNIETQAKWVEYYKDECEFSKVAQKSVDISKEILVNFFEKVI
jgi:hypothetical protein